MQARQTIALTHDQLERTLKNWFEVLQLEKIEKLFDENHPKFTNEDIQKYNLHKISDFGDHYWMYKGIHKESHKPYFFILVEARNFELLYFRACSWYYHVFEHEIDKVEGFDFNAECQVFLCSTFTIAEAKRTHIATNIFPCLYRFIPLTDLYILLGSKNPDSKFGLAYDYELTRINPKDAIPFRTVNGELADKRQVDITSGLYYANILCSDVIARMLNANPGDIISHRRLIWESGTVYSEPYKRIVQRVANNLNAIQPDGKCFGNMQLKDDDNKTKTRLQKDAKAEEEDDADMEGDEDEEGAPTKTRTKKSSEEGEDVAEDADGKEANSTRRAGEDDEDLDNADNGDEDDELEEVDDSDINGDDDAYDTNDDDEDKDNYDDDGDDSDID